MEDNIVNLEKQIQIVRITNNVDNENANLIFIFTFQKEQ